MTVPRRILPNTTYLITRRCSERRNLLSPGKKLNRLVLYLLAVSAARFGILVHAYCVMSNHLHLVLTDPHCALPAFEQYFGSLVARSCNALHGHWESFWSPGSYRCVQLLGASTILDKIVYALANPVAAGLVRRGHEWPGLRSSPRQIGARAVTVRRPRHFFDPDGPMPETAALSLVPPPGFESLEELREAVGRELARREEELAVRFARERRPFVGVERLLRQDPLSSPSTEEPRRNLNPRIACLDQQMRVDALECMKAFLRAYRQVWREFASGLRDVQFPHGTYWMRVALGLPCAEAG